MKSIFVKRKTRGRPATGTDPLVGTRMSPKMIAALDHLAADEGLSRSEAIRRVLSAHLTAKGYLDGEPPRGNIQLAEAALKRKR